MNIFTIVAVMVIGALMILGLSEVIGVHPKWIILFNLGAVLGWYVAEARKDKANDKSS